MLMQRLNYCPEKIWWKKELMSMRPSLIFFYLLCDAVNATMCLGGECWFNSSSSAVHTSNGEI
jgi:hypothetical protein